MKYRFKVDHKEMLNQRMPRKNKSVVMVDLKFSLPVVILISSGRSLYNVRAAVEMARSPLPGSGYNGTEVLTVSQGSD